MTMKLQFAHQDCQIRAARALVKPRTLDAA